MGSYRQNPVIDKTVDRVIDKGSSEAIDISSTWFKKRRSGISTRMDKAEWISLLREGVEGEVFDDLITKRAYSVDASIFEEEPLVVVQPRNEADVRFSVGVARAHRIPVIPRGAASGIAGGCVGTGMVLDLSRHMNRVGDIDWEKKTISCQAGAILDEVNAVLRSHGYRIGPELSTSDRATLGGMAAANAAGGQSLRFGAMVDNVVAMQMVLSSGEAVSFEEGTHLEEAKAFCERHEAVLEKQIPHLGRKASGYLLDRLLPSPTNVCPALVGSEGTLGVITDLTMKIYPIPKGVVLGLLWLPGLIDGVRFVEEILDWNPLSFEYVDAHIIEEGLRSRALQQTLDWLMPSSGGFFLLEFDQDGQDERLASFAKARGWRCDLLHDPVQQQAVRQLRKEGLGLLLSRRSYTRAVAFIEDIALAPKELAEFLPPFLALFDEVGIYGHIGPGCLHVRPYLNLRSDDDIAKMKTLFKETGALLRKHGGVFSGEHGDGRVRSHAQEQIFGKEVLVTFREWKELFDPLYLMNPGKIVDPVDPFASWRFDSETPKRNLETFLDFSSEGGLPLSADLCNGNAKCRKKSGVMCPSFQVTKNERDTTRARAQVLRGILSGSIPDADLSHPALKEVLDLCIGCKGCRKECPSNVDMAKMKVEAAYQHAKKHGQSSRDLLFGYLPDLLQWGAKVPQIANAIIESGVVKWVKKQMKISQNRPFPKMASQTFSSVQEKNSQPTVVLFPDTFTEFYHPEIGRAAKRVLEAAGQSVHVPKWSCCGRPLLSKGMLPQAKKRAEALADKLFPYAAQGLPIVALEPSCCWTMKDDLLALFSPGNPYREKWETIGKNTVPFEQFLANHLPKIKKTADQILYHGHCYEKASLSGTYPMKSLMTPLTDSFEEIPSGCCGMAGSFGYEEEHDAFSTAIGELELFPAVRKSDEKTVVIANGFSCRSQIGFGTEKKPLHLAEWLEKQLGDSHG